MNIRSFISELGQQDIYCNLDGDELVIEDYNDNLNDAIVGNIKANKAEIIEYLGKLNIHDVDHGKIEKFDDIEDIPLSNLQKSYWFLYQLEGGSSTFNMPSAIRLKGDVDAGLITQCFETIVNRHRVLRINFSEKEGLPYQFVKKPDGFSVGVFDQSPNLDGSERDKKDVIQKIVLEESERVFDLTSDFLFLVNLHKLEDKDYLLCLNWHHIISDGWSLGVLMREFVALYEAGPSKTCQEDFSGKTDYVDFCAWQSKRVRAGAPRYDEQVTYWRDKLAGISPEQGIPMDYARPSKQSYRGSSEKFFIEKTLAQKIDTLAKSHKTSMYSVLLAAFNVLLSRYSRKEDVVVGSVAANRENSDLLEVIGLFANTISLRTKAPGDMAFTDFLQSVNKTFLEAIDNPDIPFDTVVEEIQPERSLSVPPIFQATFRLHNQPLGDLKLPGVDIDVVEFKSTRAKLDINFSLLETSEGIEGTVEYATDLYKSSSIVRMSQHFINILNQVVAAPTTCLSEIDFLTSAEKSFFERHRGENIEYPRTQCMHELFEVSAEMNGNSPAIIFQNQMLTYAELNIKANQLAHYLRGRGVKPEDRVGLCVSRSFDMAIGMLAIMKSGGTYVPLDPSYPKDRLAHMIEDTEPVLVLTNSDVEFSSDISSSKRVCLSDIANKLNELPQDNPAHIEGASHSVYILYTSGTTGKPKGIRVCHMSFRNMHEAHRTFGLTPTGNILQFASISFSISIWGSFMAWLSGGTLVQVNDQESQPGEPLYQLLKEQRITTVSWPVSLLTVFPVDRAPESITTVISTAEPCNDFVVNKWAKPGRRFLNMYGNSEVSLGSTVFEHKEGAQLSLGKPFPNTQMYILDHHMQQCAVGVPGEVYTGGIGLAAEYINRASATKEHFIKDNFGYSQSGRLYKTGDLAKYNDNGDITFIGREDFQVNVRGFRVEVSEVEAALKSYGQFKDVAVVVKNDSDGVAVLVAYLVREDSVKGIELTDLKGFLSKALPNYMVPSLFVELHQMPLTPNRKVDRLGLPEPDRKSLVSRAIYKKPETELQASIVTLWSQLLNIKEIGIDDDFFDLGGHSLLAVKLASDLKSICGFTLPVPVIFQYPTISCLADYLQNIDKTHSSDPYLPTLSSLYHGGGDINITLIHPVGGNVSCYLQLATELSNHAPDVNVYAIAAPQKYDRDVKVGVSSMARAYLELLKETSLNKGFLAGWSFGGLVAQEMACLASQFDFDIQGLCILDTIEPSLVRKNTEYNDSQIVNMFARDIGIVDMSEQDFWAGELEASLHKIHRSAIDRNIIPKTFDIENLSEKFDIFHRNAKAYIGFSANACSVPSLIFAAKKTLEMPHVVSDLGWRGIIADFNVIDVPKGHYDVVFPPISTLIGQKIYETFFDVKQREVSEIKEGLASVEEECV